MIETAFMAFGICDDAGRCLKADAVFLYTEIILNFEAVFNWWRFYVYRKFARH